MSDAMPVQITPAFVREAYSLLRQSIIHVEEDDVDFDQEEENVQKRAEERAEKDARKHQRRKGASSSQAATAGEDSQDVEMSGITSESQTTGQDESMATSEAADAPSTSSQARLPSEAPAPQAEKPRMVISHDKYMQLQSLIVLHLAEVERETGKGLDHDDLVDWYLEAREADIQSVEQLEYEKELITKVIRKLKRVSYLCLLRQNFANDVHRTTTCWRSSAMSRTRCHPSTRSARLRARAPGVTTWSIRRSTST